MMTAALGDRSNAHGVAATKEEPAGRFLQRVEDKLSEPLALVTVLGLAVFAVLRAVNESYLREFGLNPKDVGLGYFETVAKAVSIAGGTGLVLLVLVAALTAWAVWRTVWKALALLGKGSSEGPKADPSGAAVGPLAGLAVVAAEIFEGRAIGLAARALAGGALTGLVSGLFWGLSLLPFMRRPMAWLKRKIPALKRRLAPLRPHAVLLGLGAIVVMVAGAGWLGGYWGRQAVLGADRSGQPPLSRFLVIEWPRPTGVRIISASGATVERALLVGTAEGGHVLFDPCTRNARIWPVEAIALVDIGGSAIDCGSEPTRPAAPTLDSSEKPPLAKPAASTTVTAVPTPASPVTTPSPVSASSPTAASGSLSSLPDTGGPNGAAPTLGMCVAVAGLSWVVASRRVGGSTKPPTSQR